jgi:hypothetical protein
MTEAQREAQRAKDRDRKKRANMTEEQREAQRARDPHLQANMTEEQHEEVRSN